MINKMSKKNIYLAIIFIILLALLIKFIISPSIIGYNTYQQIESSNYSMEDYGKDIRDLELKLLIYNTNLSSCVEFNKKLFSEFEKYSDKFSECKSNLSALKMNFDLSKERYGEIVENLEEELGEKNEEVDKLLHEKEMEISDLELEHNLLMQNVANNICCKAKVDNPNINYYKIKDNKIVCTEEGTLSISCYG